MTTPPRGPARREHGRSTLARLIAAPRRYTFDAAVRILMRAEGVHEPEEVAHFRTPPDLSFPAADVLEVRRGDGRRPDVMLGMMGLTGPSGVMPRHYTEIVSQTLRGRSTALHQFLDMLGSRFAGFFARAGMKYRPNRAAEAVARQAAGATAPVAPDGITNVLLALTGYGTGHLTPRLAAGTAPLLHYAGLFAAHPRSAEQLGAMISDWFGTKVEVIEFAGAWLNLPPDQRTRIGVNGAFRRLGVDAAAGVRAWDPEARILLRIGPLDRVSFERLLPDQDSLPRLVALVRTYLGLSVGFGINLVLAAQAVPLARLDASATPPPRLGWNIWLPASGPLRRQDAADAVFEADVIEARTAGVRRAA